jgi:Asp-tRNA(Asn)/Glu-tRNA(Gln) amidotransferase A subunit family amidase
VSKQRATEISLELNDVLSGKECFLTPSTEGAAPLAAEETGDRTAQRIWTLAGMPAISVPVGFTDGLPISVQLIGPQNSESRLLGVAAMLIENSPK